MAVIEVAAALVFRDGKLLITQRQADAHLGGLWEFPGGKIERGESPQECLQRELMEEMCISVHIERQLPETSHHYDDFTITLYPFICRVDEGTITLNEHVAARWVPPREMHSLDWAQADLPVIAHYLTEKL